jgi:pimeloyl-ACP methyl ester carboxylesterase
MATTKLALFLSILAFSPSALAIIAQAANFNVSASLAETYGCGPKCYETLQKTNAVDLSTMGTEFDFSFYEMAANFSTSKPGEILKLEAVDPSILDVDSGLTVYRFQYTSQDLDGSLVPVTGFIAFPFAPPPWSGKSYPLVAFAHGTIGVYRGCAPSASPSLFDYKSWSLIAERGYAVVATDYAGLGNNHTGHKYCSHHAHANDIFYSVIAAQKAFGHKLTKDWVSAGHSQGGGAVWKLAEQVQQLLDSNKRHVCGKYLGTVALSPTPHIRDMVYWAINNVLPLKDFHRYILTAELPSVAVALRSVYPTFNSSSILAGPLKKRLELADHAQMCTTAMMGLTADLSIEELFSPILSDDAHKGASDNLLSTWQDATQVVASGRTTAPLLVIQGLADTSVVPADTIASYNKACQTPGYEVHLRLYDGQDHSPTVVATAPEWLDWIKDRFTGVRTSGVCSNITRLPFDSEYVKEEREVDFSQV